MGNTAGVVVDDDTASEKKREIERLRVLVELFTKALDTLNQSNVLLAGELQSALSFTLQHVCPDGTSSTDDLIKLLESNISSLEEVRANYVKSLCSRLVALNDEKLALLAENTSLRESLTEKEKEFTEQVADAILTTQNIEMLLTQLEYGNTNYPSIVSESTTMGDLCASLNSIYERLSRLQLKPTTNDETVPDECQGAMSESKPTPRTMVSVGVLTSDDQIDSLGTPKRTATPSLPTPAPLKDLNGNAFIQDLPPPPAYPNQASIERVNPQVPDAEPNELVPPVRIEEVRTEGAGRGTPQPSYSANQEEPWCPCCYQRFASRDDLETHLLSCLT